MANVLGTSTWNKLLWRSFWVHWLWTCCFGQRSGWYTGSTNQRNLIYILVGTLKCFRRMQRRQVASLRTSKYATLLFVLWFPMLLRWSCCSLSELLCCCGEALARFVIRNSHNCCGEAPARFVILNIAVVKLLLVLRFAMLFSYTSCSFCILQCCCGEALARFVIRNVSVVLLLLILRFTLLIWLSSWSLCNLQCCCGEPPARFVICNVVLVNLLLVVEFAISLLWNSCSLYKLLCCCGEPPARFIIHNVAVVKLLLAV